MKNKRTRTQTKTVLTAVVCVAIGLVLHRPRGSLLSGGFAYGNELTLFGTAEPTLAIYHSFLRPQNLRTTSVLQHNVIGVNNITLFIFRQ